MNNLKFRAWDNDSKKWLLGYDYPNLGGFSLFGETIIFGEWGSVLNEFLLHDSKNPDALKVMQYTGVNDKYGKEIYDGDILATSNDGKDGSDAWAEEVMGEVFWDNQFARFSGMPDDDDDSMYSLQYCYVVGNIYENPELLKK